MAPGLRKPLSQDSTEILTRFGIHLRDLLDERQLSASEFLAKLRSAGVVVTNEAVKKWLSGDRFPRPDVLEGIGRALQLADYRHLLPPASSTVERLFRFEAAYQAPRHESAASPKRRPELCRR